MRAPVHRLKKADIVWLGGHNCKHGHSFLEHYSCYLAEHPNEGEKIGFIDIETSNLDANYGIMFSYCIKPAGKRKIIGRIITPKELKGDADKEVCKQLLIDINKFDKLVGYYSTKFDIPFIRTRCVKHGLEFPEYGQLFHKDVYYIIRNKFKFHRNRQEIACRFLLGKTEKTHLDPEIWIKAIQGNREALDYIYDHNKRDVRDLEKLYNKVIGFNRASQTSI